MQVAKLLLQDRSGRYLLLERSEHPTVPHDPDVPGGIVEADETPLEAVVRESVEEIGVTVDPDKLTLAAATRAYSPHQNEYILYTYQLTESNDITISWEHAGFEWLDEAAFIEKARSAIDHFMWLTADAIQGTVKTEAATTK